MAQAPNISPDIVQQIEQLVIEGVGPQLIANKFGISVSTVHNYKTKMREKGIEFASVRGKTTTTLPELSEEQAIPREREIQVHQSGAIQGGVNHTKTSRPQNTTYIINGTSVQISSQAKNVKIDKDANGLVMRIDI